MVWLRNEGSRTAPLLAAAAPIDVAWDGAPPRLAWGWKAPTGQALLTQWRTTPVGFDFTGDGLPDLAMLDTEGYLVLFERARTGTNAERRTLNAEGTPSDAERRPLNADGAGATLRLKAPRRVFVDEAGAPLRLNDKPAGGSGRRKLAVVDWNGDGRFDFLVNSVNANLLLQVATRDGRWVFKDAGPLTTRNIEGHDVSPATVDFDADGIPDFLGGAEDGRLYYLRHPR